MSSPNAGTGSSNGVVSDTGFARLHGQDFDYYIHYYEIIVGRDTKKEKVDLDLTVVGGAKDISRRHARIFYDFKHRTFALEVLGKNGCYVQRELYLPGDDPVKLVSQDLIQIGGTQFYFLQAACTIDESIAAQDNPQSFSFRGITYHVDPATGSVRHTPIPSQFMATTASAQHTPIPPQPIAVTASAQHTTHTPSRPMPATTSAQDTPIQSQPMAATASAQHTKIPSQPMSSSSMRPVHSVFSTLRDYFSKALRERDYNYRNSHGCANGESGTVISTGTQGTFMKQNNRSLVELDLNVEAIETLGEDENTHGCANGDRGVIVGTITQQGPNMDQNNMSFGALDLNVEPIGTPDEDAENTHGSANGDGGIIVCTGTQGPNTEQNNRSFSELDLNVEPIGTLDEDGNGHGLANGESANQGTVLEQINRYLGELDLNVEPTGTLSEHVNEVEIRTVKDKDNPQLRQKEESDLMSYVASLVSNHSSTTGWVPAAEVHAELVKHFSKTWPSSTVQKYLASDAGSSTGAVEKPWHKLLELLRECPEKFVICSLSIGTETSDLIGFLRP